MPAPAEAPIQPGTVLAWLQADESQAPVDPLLAGSAAAPDQALALGMALRSACQAEWNRQPGLARRAAQGLAALARQHPERGELTGLAHWAEGLAELVQGHMAAGLDRLQAGAACFDGLGQPDEAARLRLPCLMALSLLGEHAQAEALARQLLVQLEAAQDTLHVGKVALNLGSLLLRRDRYAEAAHCYRRATAAFARAGDRSLSIMADIGLATTLTWQFQFDEAGLMLNRAQQRAQAHELPVLEALALAERGQLGLHRGALAQALSCLEQAVDRLAGRAPPQRQLEVERARVEALLAARLLPETRQACHRLIAQAEALAAPVEAAWARLMRAEAALLAGQWPAAEDDLVQARAAFLQQGNAAGSARTDLLQAHCSMARQQPEEALGHAQRSAAALAELGLTRWQIEADVLCARSLLVRGTWPAAQALLEDAAARAGDAPQRASVDSARAELALQQGDWARAQAAGLAAAERHEALRRQVPSGDMRVASQLDAQANDDLLVQLAWQQDEPLPLLRAMERSRARCLLDQLLDQGPRAQRAGAEDSPDEQGLRTRLNWLQQQWHLAQAAADVPRLRHLGPDLAETEARWLQGERRRAALALAGGRPHAADGGSAPRLDPVTAALASLPEGHGLLMFHVCGDTWHAVLAHPTAPGGPMGPAGPQRRSGPMAPVRVAWQQLSNQLDSLRQPGAAHDRHAGLRLARTRQVLHELHRQLLAPWDGALPHLAQLLLLPHGMLHALPWAAIWSPDGPGERDTALVLAPSLAAWLHSRTRPALQPLAPAEVAVLGPEHARLPALVDEARRVAGCWGPAARAHVGPLATLAAWRAEAREAGLLHLACHATARADSPAFSALHLHDGPLSLHQVSSASLAARLVVLSACDTLISQIAPGDEVLGLARGFLQAGARAVVATLWPVADHSTAAFMGHFHAALAEGQAPGAALGRARARLARQWPHPFHWAPFVLIGADD